MVVNFLIGASVILAAAIFTCALCLCAVAD